MAIILLLCCAVILSCIIANRFSSKFGMPALLCFMALGMIFGSDGLFKISFNNYIITEQLCTIALIFIMFYGMDTVFVIALVLLSYAPPTLIGGNGYLTVYLTGIILGNSPINKIGVTAPLLN